MLSVALTGNIASGKSTVLAFFKQWGAAITDADAIVHCDCPSGKSAAEYVGRIVKVRVTGSSALSLSGVLA